MVEPSAPVPRFVIIGAQKSATRWLRANLGKHPDIFTPRSEVHYWNIEHRVTKLGMDWYREQFEGWNGEPITGEATPGYMIWRHHPDLIAARMKEHFPQGRLIAILRNPIDRATSAMVHHVRRGRLPADSNLLAVVRERTPPEKDRLCLVTGGWYAASLEGYIDAFGDGLLVVWQDDINTDPEGVYDATLRHIGASPTFRPPDLSKVVFSNRNRKSGQLYEVSYADRLALWEYFRDDVARLEQLLDVDLSHWEPRPGEPTVAAPATGEKPRAKWWPRRRGSSADTAV